MMQLRVLILYLFQHSVCPMIGVHFTKDRANRARPLAQDLRSGNFPTR